MYCEVTSICVFHEDAESVSELLEEGSFVGDDVGWVNAGEESDLIEGIIFLSGIEGHHFDLFHGVDLVLSFVFSYLNYPTKTACS